MVDLLRQAERLQPGLNESMHAVVASGAFIQGPEVKLFAAELAAHEGVRHVVPCANGTDALQLAFMALGLKPGDEVIVPVFTYVATAEVIALLGLTPVLVDVDPVTFLLQPEAVEAAVTPRTKAVVPVHLFGQCAPMEGLLRVAERFNLFVVEDTAQAIGATYTFTDGRTAQAGTMGHIGCTSFFPSKNLGCFGDGGALFTQHDDLAALLQQMANHGQKVKYYHDTVGINSRLDTLQAAVLRVKLPHLRDFAARRQAVAAAYDAAFSGNDRLKIPVRAAQSTHVFHQYTLLLQGVDRAAFQAALQERGVPTMVYYPVPLHLQKAYARPECPVGTFPVAEHLAQNVVSLPIHTEMQPDEIQYIIHTLNQTLSQLPLA
jgi:dTDP-4-amino-4,6-dideoxygalactose transaminase